MAIITISRQIASFGDEIAAELSRQLGYVFINRKKLEEDLANHGLTLEKVKKYDEKKPGFWASLARDRDEYFDYLRESVYESAKNGNVVIIGRGGFAMFKDIPGCYAVRLVSSDAVRISRLMKEFSWNEKKAQALIQESDNNRHGFHKCFFNTDVEDPSNYNLTINTDTITPQLGADLINYACGHSMNPSAEDEGVLQVAELLLAQKIVNHIVFDLKIPIHFLEATPTESEIRLHGVADSAAVIENVIHVARNMAAGRKIISEISIVQDYKTYP